MKNLEAYINTLTDLSAQSLAILQECMVPLTFKVTANLTIIKMEKTLTSHFILNLPPTSTVSEPTQHRNIFYKPANH